MLPHRASFSKITESIKKAVFQHITMFNTGLQMVQLITKN